MTFILDSSVLFELEKGFKKTIDRLEPFVSGTPFSVSFMSFTEFLVGIEPSSLAEKARAKEFMIPFTILNTTNTTALILAQLKRRYQKNKSITDLFIAAQAIEHNLTLITSDRDFEDIAELKKVIL